VLIGGQVGITGHIEVGDNTIICAQAGISKSISGGVWFLTPAVPLDKAKEQNARIHRLGKLYTRVEAIEKKLGL
jgi:UDP-3-O-[3-hydroxymyristoyl] glucosamine N-acyltransferase